MPKLILTVLLLMFICTPVYAAKYELAVAVTNEPANGVFVRQQAGDIVTIKPHPWNWGAVEIRNYLIVIVEINRSYSMLKGRVQGGIYRDLISTALVTERDYLNGTDAGRAKSEFEMVFANRYKFAIAKIKQRLPDLNLAKVANKLLRYQPFKNKTQLLQKFDGLNRRRFLTENDVDCVSTSKPGDTSEFSIDLESIPAIIRDNLTDTLIKL